MISKAQCLALARKKFGKNADILDYKISSSPQQRESAMKRREVIREEMKQCNQITENYRTKWRELAKAARFALDVNGDEPSWSQLEAATVAAEQYHAACDKYTDLRAELHRLQTGYRYAAGYNQGIGFHVLICTDTLAELFDKLSAWSSVSEVNKLLSK